MLATQGCLEKSFKRYADFEETQSDTNPASHIPYMLFIYREELRRYNKPTRNLSKIKLHLTQKLLSYSVDHINDYNLQELMYINQEMSFSRELKSSMREMKKAGATKTQHSATREI